MRFNQKNYPNADIAEFLTNIATVYEIKNKNRFEIIAYENAAETVLTFPKPIFELWQQNPKSLDEIPNVGVGIAKKLDYLFTHHQLYPKLKQIFKNIHPAVFTLIKINGIGPKIAHNLSHYLAFPRNPTKVLEKLIFYTQNNKIKNLPHFGEKSQALFLENTLAYLGRKARMNFDQANLIAQNLIDYLKQPFPDTEFIPLGSLRRHNSTVGDIDIAAKSNHSNEILNYFVNYPLSLQTVDQGPKKASIRIKNDIHIDIMVQPTKSFGSLLQHFTGSRQHNILLRRYARKLGFSLSEYGIKNLKTKKIFSFSNEIDFYHFLKLTYIEPQDRIGDNEIEIAQKCYTNTN